MVWHVEKWMSTVWPEECQWRKKVRERGRPRLGWMDGMNVALGKRGMTVEAARQCANDGKEWKILVHM